MLKKRLIGVVFASFLTFGAFGQEVVVRVKPPHPVVETRVATPGPGYVWITGYHRWDGADVYKRQPLACSARMQPRSQSPAKAIM